MTIVLAMEEITKRYGDVTAVDRLSFEVPEGRILGFLGPNGAGKTTTLRMVLDIVRPTAGQILIFGEQPSRSTRGAIGFLPEERGLYRRMTARDSVTYFGRLKGMKRAAARQAADRLLERVGLASRAHERIEVLSKGLAQKVQLAAALVNAPRLVLLDEPFSGLDPVNQTVLEDVILDLARNGSTVVFSTHVMQHAERLCDLLLLVALGRKVFEGTPNAAQRLVPGRIRLIATRDPTKLVGVERATRGATSDGWSDWEIDLGDGVEPGQILQACFQQGIELREFEVFRPRLHDVFVKLVNHGSPVPAR